MRVPPSGPAGPRRPRGAGVCLALAAGWMAIAVVLPGPAGMVALGIGVLSLLAAAVFSVSAQWVAIQAEGALIAPAVDGDAAAAELTLRLRRMREEHVTRVDAALDEGRPDAARGLTDAYMDAALRAITDGADVRA